MQEMLENLRNKNPQAYAQFVHDLAHAIPVEELEDTLEHAKHVQSDHEEYTSDDIDPRAEKIAAVLEKTAQDYRNGKHKIGKDVIGVDVEVKQLSK